MKPFNFTIKFYLTEWILYKHTFLHLDRMEHNFRTFYSAYFKRLIKMR